MQVFQCHPVITLAELIAKKLDKVFPNKVWVYHHDSHSSIRFGDKRHQCNIRFGTTTRSYGDVVADEVDYNVLIAYSGLSQPPFATASREGLIFKYKKIATDFYEALQAQPI